ncbi:MAG: SpoIIE family protein phosphatase [Fluviicola sp.]
MPTRFIFFLTFAFTLNGLTQQPFESWKNRVYKNLDQPSLLVKDLRTAGAYLHKKESDKRKAFLDLNDTLAARDLHFERRLFLDTLVSNGKKLKLREPILAKYMLRLASACYDTDQGERAVSILNELLTSKYQLPKLSRIECFMMLGNLELNFQLPERAISKYKRALAELNQSLEKKRPLIRSSIYNNIGLSFYEMQQIDSALFYHRAALKIRKKQNNTFQIGQSLNNIGTMYYRVQSYDSALVYFQRGLYYRSISAKATESSLAESWINIGKTHFRLGNNKEALELLNKSLIYGKRASNLVIMQRTYEILHELYASEENTQAAYEALANFYLIRDSLYGLAETKEILHSSYKQELREQALRDSLDQEANQKIFEERSQREEIVKYGLGIALVALVLILGLLLRNYWSKIQSNKQISLQKNSLEEKNQEIIGSITYAKRLQTAILPSEQSLNRYLPDQFVFYQPKDIVAGDFYWMQPSQSGTFFAVSDCTGHGVPGALVSIVCSNALNRATKEFGLKETGAILDKATELVLESFSESVENVNDGMDVSLIRLEGSSLQFSGAYNALWVVTENSNQLEAQLQPAQFRIMNLNSKSLVEIKANRQPVGYYENRVPFDSVDINLQKGDMLYLLTDGFGDQFGGDENKKYKTSQLKRFLLSISDLSVLDQKSAILNEFEQWKGTNEQVDDICLVGIRID